MSLFSVFPFQFESSVSGCHRCCQSTEILFLDGLISEVSNGTT